MAHTTRGLFSQQHEGSELGKPHLEDLNGTGEFAIVQRDIKTYGRRMSLIAPITDPGVLPRWCDMTSEAMAITIKARPNEIVYRCFKECGFQVEPPLVL